MSTLSVLSFFFFNDTATTEIYTLSLHDALPICSDADAHLPRACPGCSEHRAMRPLPDAPVAPDHVSGGGRRSEEHTSELQSRQYLVCRLLLEKKIRYILSHHCISLSAILST